ncbi:PQQ-binding-like beta-propeller repeat protein [Fervidobacterium thailandense]|uniref:Fibronectin type-III domain-containing protein n=1 Tax=Fervidobacterium thailandense TaxID=1008305 RepID=A0A1E3G155_9BACT|nr:PQQ-binding-like beta-propeller repeat protein [Fervidobacterium thailandense]ODN29976.1 hypothetical protein A4H02_07825 [Fervidobacterium thailandense]
MRKVRFLWPLAFSLILIFSGCAIFSFFNQAPVKPHTPSPSHDSTEVLTNVTLSWQCSDPEGDTLTYDIYFGTVSSPPLVKSNHTTSSYVPEPLLGNRTYYWMIVAKDSKGAFTSGDVWSFKTLNTAPSKSANPKPSNNALDVDLNESLSWDCSDPDGDALVYDIYFGTTTNPPLVKENCPTPGYSPGTMYFNTEYHWKVVAKDPNGGVASSDLWVFRTRTTPTTVGTTDWSYPLGADFTSPAVDSNNRVYVSASNGYLYAFNVDGNVFWTFNLRQTTWSSPAIGNDGTVYQANRDGILFAINPDGTKKWEFNTESTINWSSPAIASDGTIYIGTANGRLYAIAPIGVELWHYDIPSAARPYAINSSPAIGPAGEVYFGCEDGKLYALNPNGILLWTFATGAEIVSSPAIAADGTIYFGSTDWKVYAVKPDGTLKWEYTTGFQVLSSPVIGPDGTVYIASRDNRVYALNGENGSVKWSFQTEGQIYSTPALGKYGFLYVASWDKKLYALKVEDGTIAWYYEATQPFVWSSPAITSDGFVCIGNFDGTFYAIQSLSPGLENSQWPRFRKNNASNSRF